jgi:hypothetical protein
MERKSLSDILRNGNGNSIRDLWKTTEAAGELTPLPTGEYTAHIVAGDLEASRTNATPGYKLTFRVCEGPHAGRHFWHDCWLTPAALPQTKRDLQKLGVTDLDELERPLPRGIRCHCKLVLRKDDDGKTHNRVRSFTVVGIDAPEADEFAPSDEPSVGEHPEAEAGNANAGESF